MKPEIFLQTYFLEKISKKEFDKIKKMDLLANGVLDSLDIVILSTKIKIETKYSCIRIKPSL